MGRTTVAAMCNIFNSTLRRPGDADASLLFDEPAARLVPEPDSSFVGDDDAGANAETAPTAARAKEVVRLG